MSLDRARWQVAGAIALILLGVFIKLDTGRYDAQTTADVTAVLRSAPGPRPASGAGTSFAPIPHCRVRLAFEADRRTQQTTVTDHPTLCGTRRGDPVTVYYASADPTQVGLAPSPDFGLFPISVGLVWLIVLGVRRRLRRSPGLERRRTA